MLGRTRSILLVAATTPVSLIVDKVSKDIREWIVSLSAVRNELGGFSVCPFAHTASFTVIECSLSDIEPVNGFDVAIFVVGEVSLENLLRTCEELNQKFSEYIFLDDHISEPTYLNGVQTNNGKYNLIIAQKKDKLEKARENLHKTTYYEYWAEEMYNRIVKG